MSKKKQDLFKGIPIIDADGVFKSGDPESFALTSTKQPHSSDRFSKGMFIPKSDITPDDLRTLKALSSQRTDGTYPISCDPEDYGSQAGTDGDDLMGLLVENPFDPEMVRMPFSFGATLDDIPSEYLIDLSDISGIKARLDEAIALGADLQTRINLAGLNCKDQNGTNFCWANAPTHQFEIARVISNDELIYFSPASVAGPLNNFRNQGGWGGNALKRIIDVGLAPVDIYPANQVSKPSNFSQAMEVAAKFKATECWNLPSWRSTASALVYNFAAAVGYNWWSHEVTAIQLLVIDGVICLLCRNSWGMSYGDGKGFFILRGSKMIPDDACCLRVPSPAGR